MNLFHYQIIIFCLDRNNDKENENIFAFHNSWFRAIFLSTFSRFRGNRTAVPGLVVLPRLEVISSTAPGKLFSTITLMYLYAVF